MNRKTLLSVCLGLFIFLSIGWAALWFISANASKQQVEQVAKRLKQQGALSYTGIETGGFPFSVQINLLEPHFRYDAAAFIREFLEDMEDEAIYRDLPNLPWITDMALSNALRLRHNVIGTSYTVAFSGDLTIRDSFGSLYKSYAVDLTKPLALRMTLPLTTPWQFWTGQIEPEQMNAAEGLKLIRSLSLSTEGLAIRDVNSGARLGSTKEFMTELSHVAGASNGRSRFEFSFYNEETELLPGFADYMLTNPYLRHLNQHGVLNLRDIVKRGTIHSDIIASYEGLTPDPDNDQVDFTMNVSKAQMKDNFGDIEGDFQLTIKSTDDRLERFSLKTENTSRFSHAWYAFIVSLLSSEAIIDDMQEDMLQQGGRNPFFTMLLAQFDNKSEFVAALIPKLHELGVLDINADIDYRETSSESGKLQIDAFEVVTRDYGIKVSADALLDEAGNSGAVMITIDSYDMLVKAMASYLNELTSTLTGSLSGQDGIRFFSPEAVADITRGLESMANKREASDQLIIQLTKEPNGLQVGTLSDRELRALQENITAFLYAALMQLQGSLMYGGGAR